MRRVSSACERNQEPIRARLESWLPSEGSVLEVASGTGQHAAYFGRAFPTLSWIPSDRTPDDFGSIRAWTTGLDNVSDPIVVDATEHPWAVAPVEVVFNANMLHIAPWDCAEGLFQGAEQVVRTGGALILYGPFVRPDIPTAPSNLAFHESLLARDHRWGIRDLTAVEALGAARGFERTDLVEMPANNLLLRFRRVSELPG